jgi:hypothetical protein
VFTVVDMTRLKDIVSGLNQQTSRKSAELVRDYKELNKLRASWQRYSELSRQIEPKEQIFKIGRALLLSAPTKVGPSEDAYIGPQYTREVSKEAEELAADAGELDLSTFSLWRVIREIVRQTAKIRVYELEAHLKSFGLKKASRPAIESALNTHPKEFKVTRRGREKFVSLK